ncbi:hypothetical protein RirG_017960 [Rhizophagus irregularis DAOM 197198w]|uniref:AIG1-type G domain-containing protein n=1 Tax=Rhizophagus irregularis (strain DAOM 197198w) TaxID=1432141 RepID=A0A015LZF3_RHIIW|nr:hypothetical protein RirG_017960 [Rhizophagus irregularis DAOM 197198w]
MGKEKTRNLLIVGQTGGGKSTLANVLSGIVDSEEHSISENENFQKKDFEWRGTKYRVVDTIGKEVTYEKMGELIHLIPEGLNQVLLVIDGKFMIKEKIGLSELFRKLIFEDGIAEYITIVRTKFSNFKNKDKCEADKKQLHNENENIANIVRSCRDVIYVDNPPTNIQIIDEEDEETVITNKKIRDRSRKIILDYLDKACQVDYFRLKTWDQIRKPIAEYLESNCEDVPPELEKNKEVETLIKITESFCTIT